MAMLAPCLAYFLVFHYIPMGGILIAFKDYHLQLGILRSPWVGLEHFRRLFLGGDFLHVLKNTLVISVLKLFFGTVMPILLALLINEMRLRLLRRGVQTLVLVPHFISWVILAGIFRLLFAYSGSINEGLDSLFGLRIEWLTSGPWFLFLLVATQVWQSIGYGAIIYLAALAGIPDTLYEAAAIDGAGRWKQTVHITLPGLVPTIVTLLILSMGGILSAGFDQIYNLYNPAVYHVSDIIDTYILRMLQILDFELGAAASLFSSIISMMLILLVNHITRRISQGEQGVF